MDPGCYRPLVLGLCKVLSFGFRVSWYSPPGLFITSRSFTEPLVSRIKFAVLLGISSMDVWVIVRLMRGWWFSGMVDSYKLPLVLRMSTSPRGDFRCVEFRTF